MVCNATFNNISVISWRSLLLVEETGVEYSEKTIDLPQVTDKRYHMMDVVSITPRHGSGGCVKRGRFHTEI